jgi:hypothetical protein
VFHDLLGNVAAATWCLTLEGAQLRTSLLLEMPKETSAWLRKALGQVMPGLPMSAMPGELLRAELSADLAALREPVLALANAREQAGGDAAAQVMDVMQRSFDGRMAVQVAAPAGIIVPRVGLALGIKDKEVVRRLLDDVTANAVEVKQVKFEGMPCSTVRLGPTSNVLPAFALLDDVLLVAETPATLRLLLRDRAKASAIGPGERPATPFGAPLPGFALRYDVGEYARTGRKTYGAMMDAGLLGALRNLDPETSPAELIGLVDDREFAAALGTGHGVAVPVDNGLLLTSTSSLGGPLTSAMLTVMIPYASVALHGALRGLDRLMH